VHQEQNIPTTAVSSVGEFDAPDVQFHSKVDGPPGVCWCRDAGTVRCLHDVRSVIAVVGVPGVVRSVVTGLVRRTVERHVHIKAPTHSHCTSHDNAVFALFREVMARTLQALSDPYCQSTCLCVRFKLRVQYSIGKCLWRVDWRRHWWRHAILWRNARDVTVYKVVAFPINYNPDQLSVWTL